jgi:hypothetical protein
VKKKKKEIGEEYSRASTQPEKGSGRWRIREKGSGNALGWPLTLLWLICIWSKLCDQLLPLSFSLYFSSWWGGEEWILISKLEKNYLSSLPAGNELVTGSMCLSLSGVLREEVSTLVCRWKHFLQYWLIQ